MKNQMSNASDQFANFFSRVACWLWETVELVLIIVLDCLERLIELMLAVMNLIFQVTVCACIIIERSSSDRIQIKESKSL